LSVLWELVSEADSYFMLEMLLLLMPFLSQVLWHRSLLLQEIAVDMWWLQYSLELRSHRYITCHVCS